MQPQSPQSSSPTPPLKQQLFWIGADALTRAFSQTEKLYACPICTRLFAAEAVDCGNLTFEHVPPASVGGRGITLTCKSCNSTAGHTVDAALHGRERFLELGRAITGRGGEFEGPVTILIDGIPTNAHLAFRNGVFTIEVRERQNNPRSFRGQMEALQERQSETQRPGEGMSLNLTAKIRFNFDRSRVSDLRTAFLAAFVQFGYRYAFDRRLALIRQQILRPDEALVDSAWWAAGPEITDDPMMAVVTSPFPAVLLRLRSVLVFLPWIGSPEDFYPSIRRHFSVPLAPFTCDVLDWPTTMAMLLDLHERTADGDGE